MTGLSGWLEDCQESGEIIGELIAQICRFTVCRDRVSQWAAAYSGLGTGEQRSLPVAKATLGGKFDQDFGALAGRLHFHGALQMADPLAHAGNAHAGTLALHPRQFFR